MSYKIFILIHICILLSLSSVFSQNEEAQILSFRKESNMALKAYNHEKVMSFLTDDVLITTGNGTLLSGKEALINYISSAGDSKIYWIRTTKEVKINKNTGLAWENGIWKGYDSEQGTEAIAGGNYAAMWTKASGEWKIKSQLFVSLPKFN